MNPEMQICGGEVVTGVEDIPCEKCGEMAYPCPCERVATPHFRIQYRKFSLGLLYTCAMQFKTEDEAEKQLRTFQSLFPYHYNIVKVS